MKKAIPTPVVVGVIAVFAIGALALFVFGGGGEPEFEKAPPTGITPDYIKDTMTPDQRAEVERREREAGLVADPNAFGAEEQPKQNPYGNR